jgi:DNA helicase-2/ATP-dependent DNA helicase PcrA
MVKVVLERSTLLDHYGKEKEGAERIENLEQMVSAATHFVQEEGFGVHAPAHLGPQAQASSGSAIVNADGIELLDADAPLATVMSPLSAFLAHASLEAGDAQAQAGQDAMQLMTVHSAKGLEFDAVFITGLEEGLFPHESSSRELDGVDEERRLMYVAITRARKRLYMSFTQQRMLHGQTRFNMKSRFFDELPEESLKWLSPRVQTNWFAAASRPRPGTTPTSARAAATTRSPSRSRRNPAVTRASAGASASRCRTRASARA